MNSLSLPQGIYGGSLAMYGEFEIIILFSLKLVDSNSNALPRYLTEVYLYAQ